MAEIAGTVVYRQRIALPPGSVVEVSIADVTRVDAPAPIVGRTEIVTRGQQVPLPFRIQYDEAAIEPGHRYVARVRVTVGGRLRWVNDTSVPVLGGGPNEGIVVVVAPVRG
jgi:putative lipoprotein